MTTLLEKVSVLVTANAHALIDQALKTNSLAVIQAERAELESLLELARSKELVVKTVKGLDDLVGSGDSDVSRLAQSVYRRLDKASAAGELRAASLDEQIDRLLDRQVIDAQLAERRVRLSAVGEKR